MSRRRILSLSVVLALSLGALSAQENSRDDLFMDAIQSEDFFRLDSLLALGTDSTSLWAQAFSQSMVHHSFNHKEEAVRNLQTVLGLFGSKLSMDSRIYLSSLLADNLSRQGKNKEASLMLLTLLNQFEKEGKNMEYSKDIMTLERRYLALADYSLYKKSSTSGSGSVSLSIEKVNQEGRSILMMRVPVSMGRSQRNVQLSTSESMNLITLSEAKALGLAAIGETASGKRKSLSVGSTAIAREVVIGNLRLENVPFEVVQDPKKDKQSLSYRSNFSIVLGMPVLDAMEKIELDFKEKVLVINPPVSQDDGKEHNMMITPGTGGLCMGLKAYGEDMAVFLDTGSGTSTITSTFLEKNPQLFMGLEEKELALASSGEVVPFQGYQLHDFSFLLDGKPFTVPEISVCKEQTQESLRDGIIGLDVLTTFSKCRLDLERMSISLIP